jgi:hypothetical protein
VRETVPARELSTSSEQGHAELGFGLLADHSQADRHTHGRTSRTELNLETPGHSVEESVCQVVILPSTLKLNEKPFWLLMMVVMVVVVARATQQNHFYGKIYYASWLYVSM